MTDTFEDKLSEWIDADALFAGIGRLLLAVSGGADSVAMATALRRLRQHKRLSCDFVIGHVNHGLRGVESDADEMFVRELGQTLRLPVVTRREDVKAYAAGHKLSTETAGRTLRLKALAAMAHQNGCDAVATAHHTDDQAETLVHRLIRGTGFRGLSGIRPVSELYGARFVRPMLAVSRDEIIRYCTENKLFWREDASNLSIDFTRNRIRHQLLPVLENDCDDIVKRLSVLSHKSRLFLSRVEAEAGRIIAAGRLDSASRFSIEQNFLKDCPPWVFYEGIREILVKLDVGLRDYSQEHFETMRQLLEQKKAKADFPGGVTIGVKKEMVYLQVQKQRQGNRLSNEYTLTASGNSGS